nr:phospholipase-like protein [Tanacetum cinerariifolium]
MCMLKKKKYVDVMRSPYSGLSTTLNIPSIEQLANQKNVLNPFMIKKCKSVKPWIEDLSRPFKRIDKIFLSPDLEEFFSSEDTHDFEFRTWYLKMRECLEEKLSVVLKKTGVFEKKNIDPAKYKISIRKAEHVLKQGRVFGDCGVFLCMFLYGLACSVPLAVDDPLQIALAYREKMIRFSSSTRCSVLECYKTKDDIWKWFYCNLKCIVENGLTLVENDRDLKEMYEMANLHGLLDVYVFHIPQTFLVDYYLKNLCDDDSDKVVSSILRTHEKIQKHIHSMTLKEMIAWEKEESQSPCYLKSPPLKPKNSFKEFKGKALLDDFEDVKGEGEGLGSSSSNFMASHRSDDIRKKEWEYLLDIDVSDLQLSAPSYLSNSSNTSFFQSQEMDNVDEKSTRVIPGPAGRIHKLCNFKDDPTQEYIRKHLDDVDGDFKRRPRVTDLEFINDDGENGVGVLAI